MAVPSKTNVLEGPVHRHILRMLGPFSIAVIALISTGIVDTIYLGRLTDPNRPDLAIMALAAIGIGQWSEGLYPDGIAAHAPAADASEQEVPTQRNAFTLWTTRSSRGSFV